MSATTPPHLADTTVPHPGTDEHSRSAVEAGIFWAGQLVAPDGGRTFDVWSNYDSATNTVPDGPVVIEARRGGDSLVLFHQAEHGYDAVFVGEDDLGEPTELALVAADAEVVCTAGYSFDWEEEKEDWVDADDRVALPDGRTISWEEAKALGFDSFGVDVRTAGGEWRDIGSFELA